MDSLFSRSFVELVRLSALDRDYSELMKELWGSAGRWNAKRSYADVARKLGVDEETIRNRMKRLKDSGFLVGWRLLPNPALFGRRSIMQYLTFGSVTAKERAIAKVERMDGVIVAASLYETGLLVTLFDDAERSSSRDLDSLGAERESAELSGMGLPQTSFRMTPTDWQIARLMLRNAERSIADVASEVRISARTVKRRLDRMMSASAIFIMPMIDQARSSGISYQVLVESEDGEKSEVDMLVTPRIPNLIFKTSDSSSTMIYGFSGRNIPEGKELLDWLRRQRGVRSATINIVDRVVYVFDWLEREAARLAG